jgi:hypothetical protein
MSEADDILKPYDTSLFFTSEIPFCETSGFLPSGDMQF